MTIAEGQYGGMVLGQSWELYNCRQLAEGVALGLVWGF